MKDIHHAFFGNVVRSKSALFRLVVRNGFAHFVRKVFARKPGWHPNQGGEPKMSPPRSPGADVTERLSYKRWQMSAGRNNSDSENQF